MSPSKIDFAELLELDRDGRRPLRYLGEAGYLCLARGELDEAETIFDGLAALLPDDPVGPLGLAEVLLARMQPRKAEAAARGAAEAAGNSPQTMALAYELRAMAFYQLGRVADAEAALRDAQEVAPDSPSAQNVARLKELYAPRNTPADGATRGPDETA